MENTKDQQTNNAKILSLSNQQFSQVLNEKESNLNSEERVSKLLKVYEDVVTINEAPFEEFLEISDTKMQKSLMVLVGAISKFQDQCLNHAARLSKQKK